MRGAKKRFPGFKLSVREEGRKLPVPKKLLEKLTALAFRFTGQEPGDVSLVVSGDGFVAGLNEKYLGESGPTDVLSFPQRDGSSQAGPLGDIVISLDTADLQAKSMGKTPSEEFRLLYLHGLLHLLGYTHDAEEDGVRMNEMLGSLLSGGNVKR